MKHNGNTVEIRPPWSGETIRNEVGLLSISSSLLDLFQLYFNRISGYLLKTI